MNQIKLQASDKEGEVLDEIVIEISDEEKLILKEFLASYTKLLECKIFESKFPVIEKIDFKNGSLSIKVTDFDYRDIYEFLHVARPLFLKKEPASFEVVCNIFGKKFKNTKFAKQIKQTRKIFAHGEFRDLMQISINDTPLFDEKIIDMWLNGLEYHQDPDKKKFIMDLEIALGEKEARGFFVSILAGRVNALGNMAYLANIVFQKPNKIN